MKRVLFYLFAAAIVFPAETLQAQSVSPTSDPGVTVNGITWATRNVDTTGKFVANPEDFGNYFSFEEAQTACPEGWRTPVMDELRTLMKMLFTDSEWVKVNGVAGRRFGTGGNSLFLPAAGEYHTAREKDKMILKSTRGTYWSSTVPDASDYVNGIKFKNSAMWFSEGDCSRVMRSDYLVSHTLRCVRK